MRSPAVAGRARTGAEDEAALKLVDLLTVILGHASLLDAALPEGDDRRVDVAAIAKAARRALRVTAHVVAESREA